MPPAPLAGEEHQSFPTNSRPPNAGPRRGDATVPESPWSWPGLWAALAACVGHVWMCSDGCRCVGARECMQESLWLCADFAGVCGRVGLCVCVCRCVCAPATTRLCEPVLPLPMGLGNSHGADAVSPGGESWKASAWAPGARPHLPCLLQCGLLAPLAPCTQQLTAAVMGTPNCLAGGEQGRDQTQFPGAGFCHPIGRLGCHLQCRKSPTRPHTCAYTAHFHVVPVQSHLLP